MQSMKPVLGNAEDEEADAEQEGLAHHVLEHTKIGIPDPLTHAIIMLSQVPMKRTLPNTKGCSGSLAQEEEVTSQ